MRQISPILCAAVLGGCVDYGIQQIESVDIFEQNPWEKVDVLLVVDNSRSMGVYQEKLATEFGNFFTYFEDGEVDWQIAVIHTDVRANDFGKILDTVTADDPNPEAKFAQAVTVGTDGGGLEMGLEAAYRALTWVNPGFPREDATISVVFVSDEQDASPGSVDGYIDKFYAVKGHRARDAFTASALTVNNPVVCTPEQIALSTPGTRYIAAADRTGGVRGNLCISSLDPVVTELALTTSAMRDTFYLSHTPDLETLSVWVDDIEISCAAGVWHYAMAAEDEESPLEPAILFAAPHIPETSARIVARYRNGSGEPEGFCVDDAP